MDDLASSFGVFIGAFLLGAFLLAMLIAACRRASNRPDRRGRDDSVHMPWLYVDGGSTSASSGMQPTDSHHSGSGYRDDGHDRITPDGPSHGDSHDSGPADFGGGDSGGGGDCGGGGDGGGGGGGGGD